MGVVRELLAKQPILFGNFAGAALAVLVAFGLPVSDSAQTALVGFVIAAATLFAHQAVISPATATEMARDAAVSTAAALTGETVGEAGDVTAPGYDTIRSVVSGVVDSVGGLAGASASAVLPEEEGL